MMTDGFVQSPSDLHVNGILHFCFITLNVTNPRSSLTNKSKSRVIASNFRLGWLALEDA